MDRLQDSLRDIGESIVDAMFEGTRIFLEKLRQTGDLVIDQTTGAAGYIKEGVYYIGEKVVATGVTVKDGMVLAGESVVGTLMNTTAFLTDEEYRNNTGIPRLKAMIDRNRKAVAWQLQMNKQALESIYSLALGADITHEEVSLITP